MPWLDGVVLLLLRWAKYLDCWYNRFAAQEIGAHHDVAMGKIDHHRYVVRIPFVKEGSRTLQACEVIAIVFYQSEIGRCATEGAVVFREHVQYISVFIVLHTIENAKQMLYLKSDGIATNIEIKESLPSQFFVNF